MDHSTSTETGLVKDAKSAGWRSAPAAGNAGMFNDAIGGIETGLPLAGEGRQGIGRWRGLHPRQESEMAQVAAMRVAVLVNAAGQSDRDQQGAYDDQTCKRTSGGRDLMW